MKVRLLTRVLLVTLLLMNVAVPVLAATIVGPDVHVCTPHWLCRLLPWLCPFFPPCPPLPRPPFPL